MSVNAGMMSSDRPDWATPQDFFDRFDAVFHFDLDAAADNTNHKCLRWLSDCGLDISWSDRTDGAIWLNPPYGRAIGAWARKARNEWAQYGATVVCLLPARTDTRWFQDCWEARALIFVKGRLKFSGADAAPFPSVVAIFSNREWPLEQLADLGQVILPRNDFNPSGASGPAEPNPTRSRLSAERALTLDLKAGER